MAEKVLYLLLKYCHSEWKADGPGGSVDSLGISGGFISGSSLFGGFVLLFIWYHSDPFFCYYMAVQEHFQKYYDAVMPYLKSILMTATDKPKRMLRAKSMECISLVGMAVGKEKFRDDAKQVSYTHLFVSSWCLVGALLRF